jgi:hypothetical protein
MKPTNTVLCYLLCMIFVGSAAFVGVSSYWKHSLREVEYEFANLAVGSTEDLVIKSMGHPDFIGDCIGPCSYMWAYLSPLDTGAFEIYFGRSRRVTYKVHETVALPGMVTLPNHYRYFPFKLLLYAQGLVAFLHEHD